MEPNSTNIDDRFAISSENLEVVRQAFQSTRRGFQSGEVQAFPRIEDLEESTNKMKMKKTIKLRHLNSEERGELHAPAPDWQESTRGEELRHSTTFQVIDILQKYKIQPL